MGNLLTTILLGLYLCCAALLALYTLGQAVLLVQYLRHKEPLSVPSSPDIWPHVTVQLPIYNEQYVVQRALQALAALDYPHLHIQVLDDSTDDTRRIAAEGVAHLQKRGLSIEHVTRPTREGYKAGALAAGLHKVESAFVAVFDADFVPEPDFLLRVMPYLLAEDQLGLVQTRWSHLNPDENALTQAQRLAVDTHFMIEQQARSRCGWLMPFNGTGGVWRVAAIQEAGGWNGDTLTEDLDLSYRAQLCGWKAMLLPDVVVPGELPPQLAAYEQQQARWAVGSLQNLIAHGWDVLRSERPFSHRLMALHHLCQYVPQALMLLMLLLAPPLLLNHSLASLSLAPLGLLSLVPPLMYAVTQYRLRDDWPRSLAAFPLLVVLGTGLIWRNTAAMTQALLGVTPGFQRTPKFGDVKKRNHYIQPRQFPWAEGALMLYALLAAWLAAQREPALVPYLLLHALSFAVVAGWHLRDRLLARQQKPHESVRHMS
ncbi:MAG: glycosyltransferase [Anaerolineae bacterium]|nr:glycosyltransferase [Anaerolineae bacterium]